MKKYSVAVVGATGAVGEEIFRVLEELDFPVGDVLPLGSARSAGSEIEFKGKKYKVKELSESTFSEHEVDIAFFSAGGSVSEKYAKFACESGAVVIDNTSHFRMQPDVPLVVPECNPGDIKEWKNTGIIANPNCSTIQMVQLLKPLNDAFCIKRVDVSTYQAASGAGKEGMEELVYQMQKFFEFKRQMEYKCQFNCIEFVTVDRFYPSSKKCSACGSIKHNLKLRDRTYVCDSCGLVIDRDYNASLNLANYQLV